jgi:hypothetical protein
LEPVDLLEKVHRRIELADIPEVDGAADGWPTKTVIIIKTPEALNLTDLVDQKDDQIYPYGITAPKEGSILGCGVITQHLFNVSSTL